MRLGAATQLLGDHDLEAAKKLLHDHHSRQMGYGQGNGSGSSQDGWKVAGGKGGRGGGKAKGKDQSPAVLWGAKAPLWQCQSCHFQSNWASRVRCRECDITAPKAVKQLAVEQNDKAIKKYYAGETPQGGKRADEQAKGAGKADANKGKDKTELELCELQVEKYKKLLELNEELGFDPEASRVELAKKQKLLEEEKVKVAAGKPVQAYQVTVAAKAVAKNKATIAAYAGTREEIQRVIDKGIADLAQTHIDEMESLAALAPLEAELDRLTQALVARPAGSSDGGSTEQNLSVRLMATCTANCAPGAQKECDELQELFKKFWARNEEAKKEEADRKRASEAAADEAKEKQDDANERKKQLEQQAEQSACDAINADFAAKLAAFSGSELADVTAREALQKERADELEAVVKRRRQHG